MKRIPWATLAAMIAASCSSNPVAPNAETAARTNAAGDSGTVSSTAITTERIRLQRAGGADIAVGLVNGQTYDVPTNVALDVWAEIRRLESDRARIVADWGNGNNDFTGCGSCRLDNTYTREGRYTLSVKVIDLGAPLDSQIITSVTVTLNVYDFKKFDPLSCSPQSVDFDSTPLGSQPPFTINGIGFQDAGVVAPVAAGANMRSGRALDVGLNDLTITFAEDKNYMSLVIATRNPLPVAFTAYDSNGSVVKTGSATASTPSGSFFRNEGTLVVSGATFRKVKLSPTPVLASYDNLTASCR